mmetsp:Transcript_30860/g.78087  ORF Transcript_30860/g.78087 Transcript_30860/m.78087 type:complete len:375 (+) Transcript_30860:652-1776(+)
MLVAHDHERRHLERKGLLPPLSLGQPQQGLGCHARVTGDCPVQQRTWALVALALGAAVSGDELVEPHCGPDDARRVLFGLEQVAHSVTVLLLSELEAAPAQLTVLIVRRGHLASKGSDEIAVHDCGLGTQTGHAMKKQAQQHDSKPQALIVVGAAVLAASAEDHLLCLALQHLRPNALKGKQAKASMNADGRHHRQDSLRIVAPKCRRISLGGRACLEILHEGATIHRHRAGLVVVREKLPVRGCGKSLQVRKCLRDNAHNAQTPLGRLDGSTICIRALGARASLAVRHGAPLGLRRPNDRGGGGGGLLASQVDHHAGLVCAERDLRWTPASGALTRALVRWSFGDNVAVRHGVPLGLRRPNDRGDEKGGVTLA